MLTMRDYDKLVIRGFEALRREIDEAEQYTVEHHNNLLRQEKEALAEQQNQNQAVDENGVVTPKSNNTKSASRKVENK